MRKRSCIVMILAAILFGSNICLPQDTSPSAGLNPWDVNEDGIVNLADLILVAKHLGDGSAELADVNKDNSVNILDIALVSVHLGEKYSATEDGVPMALIPAGEFQMGDHFNEGRDVERPVHTVYVDAFYMDIYEVTNAQYRKFMDATGHGAPYHWNDSRYKAPEQPVVAVSWHDAVAYAEWAGKRLPTEAEWEKAARGGLTGKRYPWGDEAPDAGGVYRVNYDPGNDTADGYAYTSPAGSFAPNGYGLYDMAGNVLEWCTDWYDGNYYANSPYNNPLGPDSGKYRVLRGGAWSYPPYFLRAAFRTFGTPTTMDYYVHVGFRCVSKEL